MSGHVQPVLASALGSVMLAAFWASCLLGPGAFIGVIAHVLGSEAGTSASLTLSSLTVTILALKNTVDYPGVWRSM